MNVNVNVRSIRSFVHPVLNALNGSTLAARRAGNQVASGIYLVQVEGRARAVGRVTLVR